MRTVDALRKGNKNYKIIREGIMYYLEYFLTVITFPQERNTTTFKLKEFLI